MKKRIIAFLCLCVMVLSIFPCVPEKALAAEEFYELKNGQVITLKNASSGWFMNLQHGTDANGTKINVYPWDETPPYTQKYKVSLNADGSFKLATLCAPSRFVDVRRYSKPLAESQGIVIWAEDGDTHKHLRLKKVGDKVAIVFANNTNLCIAPSSVSAAKTTQTQMIVRKLDTSKTEMLWNVCDEKGVELSSEIEKQVVNSTYDQTSSLRVILSPVCVEGMALTISDNDTLVYAPIAATMQELDKQIFTISESRYGQNRYSIGIQCGQEEKVLTACSLSNGGNVLMTYDFNFNPNRSVTFHIERADYCLFNCGINAIKNGDNLVFSFDNGYVLDVKDFGQTADHSVQIWQGDAGNTAQMFTVTIVDDAFLIKYMPKEKQVQFKIDNMLAVYRNRYEEIFQDKARAKEIDFNHENVAYFYGYCSSDGRPTTTNHENRNGTTYIVRDWFKEAFGFEDDYLLDYKKSFAENGMYTCCAFASLTADYLFAEEKGWYLNDVPSFEKIVGSCFNWDFLLKNNVKAGDLLYLGNREHYVVVYDVDYTKETLTIVHANAHQDDLDHCGVVKETLTKSELERKVGIKYTHYGESKKVEIRRFY